MAEGKDFFEEEIIDGYRVSRELKEVWAVYIDLLAAFQRFCERHQLRFFIGFGTLLGAFRHQGFIPWDDDIDILMPREDFERLKGLSAEISTPPYFLQSSASETEFWYRGMMKFRNSDTACIEKRAFDQSFNQGIALEILPLDRCPDRQSDRRVIEKKVGLLHKLLWAKVYGADYQNETSDSQGRIPRWKWQLCRLAAQFCSKTYLESQLWKLCTSCMGVETQCYALYTSYGAKDIYKVLRAADFSTAIEMPFETLLLPAPVGFWNYLEQQYGKNFLSYIDGDKRKPHHPAFWAVDESYKVYQKRFQDVFKETEHKVIVLFGTGNMVLDYEKKTKERYRPAFYVDNDKSKWGQQRDGIPIKSPESLLEVPKEKLHLIICNNYFREIGQQLRRMGIDTYYIYVEEISSLFGGPNEIGIWSHSQSNMYRIGYIDEQFTTFGMQYMHFLAEAKKKCAYLVVGIADTGMTRAKLEDRKKLIKAISYVDCVVEVRGNNLVGELKKMHSDCLFLIENYFDEERVKLANQADICVEYLQLEH